jgi:uncharacterized integral membrane protein
MPVLLLAAAALLCAYGYTQRQFVAPSADRDRGQMPNNLVWIVVGVLAAIALIIFIVANVNVE